jgi:hypothetical protein
MTSTYPVWGWGRPEQALEAAKQAVDPAGVLDPGVLLDAAR